MGLSPIYNASAYIFLILLLGLIGLPLLLLTHQLILASDEVRQDIAKDNLESVGPFKEIWWFSGIYTLFCLDFCWCETCICLSFAEISILSLAYYTIWPLIFLSLSILRFFWHFLKTWNTRFSCKKWSDKINDQLIMGHQLNVDS